MGSEQKQIKCVRCGYTWTPIKPDPRSCPKCKSYQWNTPKKKKYLSSVVKHDKD